MKIAEVYSHLNGLEFLLVHKPKLWAEIQHVIKRVDANACKTKVSKEKGMVGKLLYSPVDMNARFKSLLRACETLGRKPCELLGYSKRKTHQKDINDVFSRAKERDRSIGRNPDF